MSKLTDYGFVVLSRFTAHDADELINARDLATETRLPLPTVSKLLKVLTRSGLLQAHRGVKGGYSLARNARSISATDIIEALEGPIAFTDCTTPDGGKGCAIEDKCPNKSHWQQITHVVRNALCQVSLQELAQTENATATKQARHDSRKDRISAAMNCTTGSCGGGTPACTCGHDESTSAHLRSTKGPKQ
ncbi:MAG: SUF system Fe-S cluster assembly regulator [Candidatus Sumerlaeaceae bacterium]